MKLTQHPSHTWKVLQRPKPCIQFSEFHSINYALRRVNEILAALGRPNLMSQFIALVSAYVCQYQYMAVRDREI